MIALASPAVPRLDDDALVVVLDQDAKPTDLDRFLDALDRLVERRLSQRGQNETGSPAKAARFSDSSPSTLQSQEATACPHQV